MEVGEEEFGEVMPDIAAGFSDINPWAVDITLAQKSLGQNIPLIATIVAGSSLVSAHGCDVCSRALLQPAV